MIEVEFGVPTGPYKFLHIKASFPDLDAGSDADMVQLGGIAASIETNVLVGYDQAMNPVEQAAAEIVIERLGGKIESIEETPQPSWKSPVEATNKPWESKDNDDDDDWD